MFTSTNSSGGGSLVSYTWATKPSAASNSGKTIIVSDVGVNGSIWFSNGTKWIHESPIVIQQEVGAAIVPSLAAANAATYSQTGTVITVTSTAHAIPSTSNGYKVYLEIASGLAAAGWYDNFTRIDANSFTCDSTISQSTSGTVNTNTTATIVTPFTKTIQGGLMGLKGTIRAEVHTSNLNDAGTKTLSLKFGGTNYFSNTITTGLGFYIGSRSIFNKNSESAQKTQAITTTTGGTNIGQIDLAINTANDFNHTIELTCAAANEYVRIESVLIELMPS